MLGLLARVLLVAGLRRPCPRARRLRAGTRRRSARARRGSARRSSSACRRDARAGSTARGRRRSSRSVPQRSFPGIERDANAMGGFLVINPRSGAGLERRRASRRGRASSGSRRTSSGRDEDPAEVARQAPARSARDGRRRRLAGRGRRRRDRAGACRSSSFRSAPSTTSRAISGSTATIRSRPCGLLRREQTVDVGARQRPAVPEQRLARPLRAARPRERDAAARFARLRALGLLLRRPSGLGIAVDGRNVHARVIVVSNNRYELDSSRSASATRLDEGVLHLYLAHGWLPSTWEEQPRRDVHRRRPGGSSCEAAIDGEPEQLETPLRFEIEPAALRVLLPERG